MIATFRETDEFYFDAEAADRACRFIARYCRHFEGQFAGQPFALLDWQRDIIRALFGWKRRRDGLRRFRELYLLTAKGAGKTPMLAAIGLYMLLADGEQGAHVISCATDFQQAFLTLDAGKKYVAADPTLAKLCHDRQFDLRAPRTNSKWTVMSGTAEGRHGFRPSCLLMDEAHEWPSGLLYQNLTANMPKRLQPLTLVTTNAGANQSCFAWTLHNRALAVLNGKEGASESLLPVIYEAPVTLDWQGEDAARAANPSLGAIVQFDALKTEIEKAREDPVAEGRYRRLYLSQWGGAADDAWLDMADVDAAMIEFADAQIAMKSPVYVGLDLSQSDDLCSAVYVWPTRDRFYAAADFWVPRLTAERYERVAGVPYGEWADAGAITLVDSPTISSAVMRMIAERIIARTKPFKVTAVCYDSFNANETIAALEAASLPCVPIRQGYSLSPGAHELERRLKERSIQIAPNPVMRFCAENVRTKCDDRGNLWPVKPGANLATNYAGRRGAKVDGIAALITALVEARKATFAAARSKAMAFTA